MTEPTLAAFFELVAARRGHFRLESGHHGALWLDLDALFSSPRRVAPFVAALAEKIRPHEVSMICGALLGGAFLAQLLAHALGVEFCFTERVLPAEPAGLYGARYLLPPASVPRLTGKRVAMVDDIMSAGSALRGTYNELERHGATPAVAGALLVFGSVGAGFFADRGVPVEAVNRDEYELWLPADCPRCARGEALEDLAAPKRSA
jgi:orotate phosphoribosyltransferase